MTHRSRGSKELQAGFQRVVFEMLLAKGAAGVEDGARQDGVGGATMEKGGCKQAAR